MGLTGHHDVDAAQIATEVFRLPTTCFAEEDGALVNSSRWLQWHWKGAEPPGEAKSDIDIMAGLYTRLRKLYKTDGGAFPDPIVTKIAPLPAFYPAEAYHQDYARLHPDNMYIAINDAPKVEQLKRQFPNLYQSEPVRIDAK